MNKRQRKKVVMRNISNLYDTVFERNRFRKNVAIVCGTDLQGRRTLTTMMVERQQHEFSPFEPVRVSLDGYAIDQKVVEERSS